MGSLAQMQPTQRAPVFSLQQCINVVFEFLDAPSAAAAEVGVACLFRQPTGPLGV